jgi:hypothetical protein
MGLIDGRAVMDFWVESGGFPGDRVSMVYTANASTRAGTNGETGLPNYGVNEWIREEGNVWRVGVGSFPPPNTAEFGYSSLPNPVPFLTLPNAINYTSLTPPKPWISGRVSGRDANGAYTALNVDSGEKPFSIARNSTGVYTVFWSDPHPKGQNYGVFVSASNIYTQCGYGSITTSSFQVLFTQSISTTGTTVDPVEFSFMTNP